MKILLAENAWFLASMCVFSRLCAYFRVYVRILASMCVFWRLCAYFRVYVRILALKIVDNLIWYGTLCIIIIYNQIFS